MKLSTDERDVFAFYLIFADGLTKYRAVSVNRPRVSTLLWSFVTSSKTMQCVYVYTAFTICMHLKHKYIINEIPQKA